MTKLIHDITPARDLWEKYYAIMEYKRIVDHDLWEPTTYIDVHFVTEEESYEELREKALENVCECYRQSIIDIDPTKEELEAVIEDSHYFHHEAGEDWRDCPEWAQERAEVIADGQIMEMRGK